LDEKIILGIWLVWLSYFGLIRRKVMLKDELLVLPDNLISFSMALINGDALE